MPATLEKLGVLSACLALQIVLVTPVPTGREAGGVLTTAAPTPPIGPGRPKDSGPFYCKDVAHQGIPMPGRRLQAAPAPPSPASAAVCTPNPCKNGGTCYALNIFGTMRSNCDCAAGYSGSGCEKREGPAGTGPSGGVTGDAFLTTANVGAPCLASASALLNVNKSVCEPTCAPACQKTLSKMLTDCENKVHPVEDSISGNLAKQSVAGVVLKTFQDMDWATGQPPECVYPTAERGCDAHCNIQNISSTLGKCATFFMGVDFHNWDACDTQVHADHCWGVYNSLVTRCGACRDPFLKSTLVRIAESHASSSCTKCDATAAIAGNIRDLCCSGTDGFLGKFAGIDDSCDQLASPSIPATSNTPAKHGVTWHYPRTCPATSACAAYVKSMGSLCPATFLDANGLGILAQCDGDIKAVMGQGKDCTAGPINLPAHAQIGDCPADGHLKSGEGCELTCDKEYCLEGLTERTLAAGGKQTAVEPQQPRCFDGTIAMNINCKAQPVVSCSSPANGGCDPLTDCNDDTNLFGTRLVQCGPCPPGYSGSGRSTCLPCPAGSYYDYAANLAKQHSSNDMECTACPVGATTEGGNAINITSCFCGEGFTPSSEGRITSDVDQCVACEVGKYGSAKVSWLNPGECTACPKYSTTKAEGSASLDDCLCKPGYYMDAKGDDECQPCALGTYKSDEGPDPCLACNTHMTTDKVASGDVSDCHAAPTTCAEPKDHLGYTCEDYVVGGRSCKTMLTLSYNCKCTCDDSQLPVGCKTAVGDLSTACSDSNDLLTKNICDSKCTKNVLRYADICEAATLPALVKLLASAPSLHKLCG